MNKFFHGMKIGVNQYGIVDFGYINLDGETYLAHGDSQLVGKPIIDGFKFTLDTTPHPDKYAGEIVLKNSPYLKLAEVRAVTYQAKIDVDFPITRDDIYHAGLEWLNSKELPVTSDERIAATEWLVTQTKFSVIAWAAHFKGGAKGTDLIKYEMADYLAGLAPRVVTLEGETQDGQVTNFEADLIITKNGEPAQTFPVHEVVLDNNTYYLILSNLDD